MDFSVIRWPLSSMDRDTNFWIFSFKIYSTTEHQSFLPWMGLCSIACSLLRYQVKENEMTEKLLKKDKISSSKFNS